MRTTWRRVLQGVAFLVVIALLVGLTVAKFQRKIFNPAEVPVSLRVDHAGTQLGSDADVKIRGINVGRVASQHADGTTVTLSLRLSKEKVRYVPRNVRARLLPKTLFGEKFVDLVVPPAGASSEHLQPGDSIPEDTSRQAVEVERVLADLFPLLRALQPERLNAALTAIAEGLQGRGDELGRSLANLDAYLRQINPKLPTIQHDLSGLADLAESLDANAADILRIARNSIVSGQTLTSKEDTFSAFLRGTAGFADTLTAVLQRNGDALIYLADATRQTLATVYPKRDVLPGTVKGLNEMLTKLNAALNHGPALSIRLEPVNSRGGYDTPCTYPDEQYNGGCPIGQGTLPPPGPTVPGPTAPVNVLGATPLPPNSPQERDAIRALLAPGMGVPAAEVPDLAVLLLAPVLRGSVVSVS
ncbi:MAG: phospholipid/cholesterol/gamma-HCH transport system substrate-binding protein [Frankiaceae bacterium]|jgi:virulence factor Mce-like protein|nr:phospholipid/cholesterol/gamma-HCH transport system substrate-binding protein [Frankiaceae bacterium]